MYRLRQAFGALGRSVLNEASRKGPGKALLRLKSEAHTRLSVNSSVEISSFENPLSKQKSAGPESLFSSSLLRISGTSSSGAHEAKPSSEALVLKRKESSPMDDSQDPFAFDDFESDLESEKASKKRRRKVRKVEEASDTAKASGRREPSDGHDPGVLRKTPEDCGQPSPHLVECLLSGVKVLMNLTNNNPIGCRQVANCGGLDAVSSLLVAYFGNASGLWKLDVDEEVNISEGEREAEDMIVEAYTAVLLAFLSLESDVVRLAIAQLLPGDNLSSLVPV